MSPDHAFYHRANGFSAKGRVGSNCEGLQAKMKQVDTLHEVIVSLVFVILLTAYGIISLINNAWKSCVLVGFLILWFSGPLRRKIAALWREKRDKKSN
jgi:hypothetical protein